MAVGRDNQNQNSLTSIIGIFGDLGSKLDLLTKETTVVEDEPLNMAINNIEDLEKTLRLFQKEIEEDSQKKEIYHKKMLFLVYSLISLNSFMLM